MWYVLGSFNDVGWHSSFNGFLNLKVSVFGILSIGQ